MCREVTTFEGEVGFFNCLRYGSQTQAIIATVATACAADDVFAEEGGGTALYSQNLYCRASAKQEPGELPIDHEEKPRDFGSRPLPDIETIARVMRARYLEGLWVMLQRRCEVLVETYKDTEFAIKPENLNFEHKNINGKRLMMMLPTAHPLSQAHAYVLTHTRKMFFAQMCCRFLIKRRERELDRIRFEMEENWFCCLASVYKRKSKGYISD